MDGCYNRLKEPNTNKLSIVLKNKHFWEWIDSPSVTVDQETGNSQGKVIIQNGVNPSEFTLEQRHTTREWESVFK